MAFGDVINLQGDASDLLNEMQRAGKGLDTLGFHVDNFAKKWLALQLATDAAEKRGLDKKGIQELKAELKGRLKEQEQQQKQLENLVNQHLLRSARLRNRAALKQTRDEEAEQKKREAQEKAAADKTTQGQHRLFKELGDKRQQYVNTWKALLDKQDALEERQAAKREAREKRAAAQTKRGQEKLYKELGDARQKYVNMWSGLLDQQERDAKRAAGKKDATGFLEGADTSLGGIKTGATKQGLLNIATAKGQIESLIIKGKVSRERMQELFDQIRRGATTLDILTESERRAEIALRRLTRAYENLGQAGKRTQEILLSWRSVLRLQQIQLLHYAIGAVGRSLEEATRAGAEFKVRIAEIQTISQRNQQTTGAWSRQLIDLSNAFDLDLLDTTSAAYEAISNQIAEGARITPFLTTAFEFARTTSSTAMESVNLLSSALNGFNLAAFQTEQTAAQLFKTIEVGRVRTEQIANIFGNSIPMANALGVSMAELNAGLATLTKQGTRPDTSLTLMNNIMLKMVKPSTEMVELFKEWGVESGEAAIATYGFFGVLQKLAKEAESGGLTRIAEIAQDMRAIRGLIGNLGGGAFKDYEESLNDIKNAQNDYAAATKIMAENSGTALKRIRREIDNTLTKEMSDKVGQALLAFESDTGGATIYYIKELTEALSNLVNISLALTTPLFGIRTELSTAIPVFVGYAAGLKLSSGVMSGISIISENYNTTLGKMTDGVRNSLGPINHLKAAFGLLQVATDGTIKASSLFRGALGLITTNAIPLVVAGLSYLAVKYFEHQQMLVTIADDTSEKYRKADEQRLKEYSNRLAKETQLAQDQSRAVISNYNKFLALQNKVIQSLGPKQSLDEIIRLEEVFTSNLVDETLPAIDALYERMKLLGVVGRQFAQTGGLTDAEKIFDRVAKYAGDANEKIRSALKLIEGESKQVGRAKEESILEQMLFGKKDKDKIKILTDEINKLMASANTKAGGGLFAGSTEDLKRAEQLVGRLLGMQDEKKKSKADPIFGLQNTIYDEQLRIQKLMTAELEKRKSSELAIVEANTKLLKAQQEADEKRKVAQEAVKNELKGVQDAITEIRKKQDEAATEASKLTGSFAGKMLEAANTMTTLRLFRGTPAGNVAERRKFQGDTKTSEDVITMKFDKVSQIEKKLDLATKAQDSAGVKKYREELQKLYAELKIFMEEFDQITNGEFVYGNTRESFKRLLQDLSAYDQQLKAAVAAPADLEAQKRQLDQEAARLQALVVDESAKLTALAAQYPDILAALTAANAAANNEAERTIQLTNALKNSTGQNAANIDSLRGFATGGRYGRDNLVGRFSPNEMVMNPQATARFGPMLSSMNASGRPSNAGSSIVNVGDININAYANANGQLDTRTIGRNIRRAIQRKEIKLQ